jgi:hypothetical protein
MFGEVCRGRRAGASFVVLVVACSPQQRDSEPSLECGAGTVEQDGSCVVARSEGGQGGATSGLVCGPGTTVVGNTCMPDDSGHGGTGDQGSGSGGQAATAFGGDNGSVAGAGVDKDTGGSGGRETSVGNGASSGTSAVGRSGTGGEQATGGDSVGTAGGDDGSAGTAGGDDGSAGEGGSGAAGPGPAAFECGSRDVTNATVITGAITQSQTWSGLIHMPQGVSVRNEATITIAPGTKIIVGLDADVEFGWEDNHPTLQALGTPEEPILICGETDRSGYWGQLALRQNVSPESTLSHVLISDAGGAGAALSIENSAVLQGVQVIRSGGHGIAAAGFGTKSSGLMVSECASYPLWLTKAQAVNEIPPGSFLTGNTHDGVGLAFTSIDANLEFRNLHVPYVQTSGISVQPVENPDSGISVVFDAGVEVLLAAGSTLSLAQASVVARGTAEAPVVFTGACANPTDHLRCDSGGGLRLGRASLTYVSIEDAGEYSDDEMYLGGALQIYTNEPVTLDHVTIRNPHGIGVRLGGADAGALGPSSRNLLVESDSRSAATPIVIDDDGFLYSLPGDTLIPAGSAAQLDFSEFRTSGTIRALANAAYASMDGLRLLDALAVTLEPGVEIRFGQGQKFDVYEGASLTAIGTAERPITFGAVDQSRNWRGLLVQSTAAAVTLDHVVLDHGGYSSSSVAHLANLTAARPVSITNSLIQHSAGYGIQHAADDATDYQSTNTFSDNHSGDMGVL